mmetsp:Transcript_20305/g.39820  ORF Transcript_20305/g.39820 Transcript_20305/m.39820 type:complete len:594 (+) Transcript_20305:197-1978(+)
MTVAVVGTATPHPALLDLCTKLTKPWGEEQPLKLVTLTIEVHQLLSEAKVPHRHAFSSSKLGLNPDETISCVVVDLATSREQARKPEEQALAELLRTAVLDADKILPLCSPEHYQIVSRGVNAVQGVQRTMLAHHAARMLQAVEESAVIQSPGWLTEKGQSVLVLGELSMATALSKSPCVKVVHYVPLSAAADTTYSKVDQKVKVHSELLNSDDIANFAQKEECSLACTFEHTAHAQALMHVGVSCFGAHPWAAFDMGNIANLAKQSNLACLVESEPLDMVLGGTVTAFAISDGKSVTLAPCGLSAALASYLSVNFFLPLVDAASSVGTPIQGLFKLKFALTSMGPRLVIDSPSLMTSAEVTAVFEALKKDAYAVLTAAAKQSLLSAHPTWSVEAHDQSEPVHLGVLGSTRGTDMQFLIDAISQGWINACIEVVVSNKLDAYILQRARNHGIPAVRHGMKGLKTRTEFDALVTKTLEEHNVELVLLIGYMRIMSDEFVARWEDKCLNVHPSLLPEFAGGMDLNVHQEVIDAGKKETGCTVHLVTTELDGGPIIIQKRCPVLGTDDSDVLKARVQAMEGPAFVEAVWKLTADSS